MKNNEYAVQPIASFSPANPSVFGIVLSANGMTKGWNIEPQIEIKKGPGRYS